MAVEKSSENKPEGGENKPAAAPVQADAPVQTADSSAQKVDAPVRKKAAGAPTASEINVDDFRRLVASMSRLLSGFGQLKPLREARLGLGEWVALSVMARQEGITSKVMSQRLGIPAPRAAQIFVSLAESGLISIGQSSGDAQSDNVTRLTDAGKIKLEAVNSEMKAVLATAVKARTLSGALSQMRPLSRIANASTLKRTSKSKTRQAKAAKQTKGEKQAKGEKDVKEVSGTQTPAAQA